MKKNENKIENGTRESTDKVGAYAALTGFRRAVPIILAALAIFTGLCFVTQSTGALGKFIADILLGLFSVGGYVIPFLLALHAVFYASDVQKKRILSRVIFSILAVIFTSAIAHVIANFNTEFPFSASAFYNDGIDGKGGGFVGGAVAYLLTKAFGSVGLIIIAALIVALYITYFFAGGKNTLLKALLKIITAISDFFNGINEKKRKKIEAKEAKRNAKRDKKRATELAARHELLEDDEFFVADGAMKELKINDLGIREYREDEDIERDPPLHEKVVEDFEKKSPNADNPIYNGDAAEVPKRRRVNINVGV